MPNFDGTGPNGQGPQTGRGRGVRRKLKNTGKGLGQGGKRQGRGGSNQCTCPKCGHKEPHKRGAPCTEVKCPKCGTSMKGEFCS